jgi:hypothetical protein
MNDPKLTHDGEYNADLPGGSPPSYPTGVNPKKKGYPTNDESCMGTLRACFTITVVTIILFIVVINSPRAIQRMSGHIPCEPPNENDNRVTATIMSVLNLSPLSQSTTFERISFSYNRRNHLIYVSDSWGRRRCYVDSGNSHSSHDRRYVAFDVNPMLRGILVPEDYNLPMDWFYLLETKSKQLHIVPGSVHFPMSWSPDSQTLVYLVRSVKVNTTSVATMEVTAEVNTISVATMEVTVHDFTYTDIDFIEWIDNESFLTAKYGYIDHDTGECLNSSGLFWIELTSHTATQLSAVSCNYLQNVEMLYSEGVIMFNLVPGRFKPPVQTCTAHLDGSGTECVDLDNEG